MSDNTWHEDVRPGDTGPRADEDSRSWYCVSWPDGSCLHVHSLSAASAREWCAQRAPNPRAVINALTCSNTGGLLPLIHKEPIT